MKRFDKIKDKMQEKAKEFTDSVEKEYRDNKEKKNQNYPEKKIRRDRTTTNPEQAIGTMYSYFVAFWIGTFISLFAFLILLPQQKTWPLAVLILIGWPFWALFCLFMMIPDVKIFGYTVFSRKNLSLRQSVSFGKRVLYAFSRDFYNSNPTMFLFLMGYLILVIIFIAYAIF